MRLAFDSVKIGLTSFLKRYKKTLSTWHLGGFGGRK
jgi:hypothetical protein